MTDFVCGVLRIRAFSFEKAGQKCEIHEHNFGHVVDCKRGTLIIRLLNGDGTVQKEITKKAGTMLGSFLSVPAKTLHQLEAGEDGTVYHCLFPHRNFDGEIVEEYDGWEPAYR